MAISLLSDLPSPKRTRYSESSQEAQFTASPIAKKVAKSPQKNQQEEDQRAIISRALRIGLGFGFCIESKTNKNPRMLQQNNAGYGVKLVLTGSRANVGRTLWFDKIVEGELISEEFLHFEQNPPSMSADLWENLPLEILETIFAKLPAQNLAKVRGLCKRVNLFVNKVFSEEIDAVWLISARKNGTKRMVFDGRMKNWKILESPAFSKATCVGGSCGKILVSNTESQLQIFDPVVGIMDTVPNPDKELMYAHIDSLEDYRILGLTKSSNVFSVVVFQPRQSQNWVTLAESPCANTLLDAAYFNGHLYCIFGNRDACNCSLTLKLFDAQEAKFVESELKSPKVIGMKFERFPRIYLVECSGKLMMVLRIVGKWYDREDAQENLQKKRVWIFQLKGNEWVDVDTLGVSILYLSRLGSLSVRGPHGNGDLVYFAEWDAMPQVVCYDLRNCCWEEMPPCPKFNVPVSWSPYLSYPAEGLWFKPQLTYK